MTNPEHTPTRALAPRPALPPELQARIEERRLQSAMVQRIRGAIWGQQFDATTIAAVAAWAREQDVDPITEIDVLGGNIYLRARYYERQLSRLIAAGLIEYARPDWVHVDKRLEQMAKAGHAGALAEAERRTMARVEYNLSDDADAACVFRIKHRQMTEEVTGAKQHIPGGRKDPVGDAMPMETIETRALRRAMLKLREAVPDLPVAVSHDDDFVTVAEVVQANHDRLKAEREPKQIAAAPTEAPAPAATEEDDLAFDREIAAEEDAAGGELPLGDAPARARPTRNAVREGR
jgi:hypothetical protein